METRTYTERSNARRAARAFGVDPETITETPEGFTFAIPAPKQTDDESLEIPECLKKPRRTPAPDLAALNASILNKPLRSTFVSQPATAKTAAVKKSEPKADKTEALVSMLKGKGATVETLTSALGWLPHTLRARISHIAKPKSKGGLGLKIERERKDGVTTYRIAA